jgi:hypothetical protein
VGQDVAQACVGGLFVGDDDGTSVSSGWIVASNFCAGRRWI